MSDIKIQWHPGFVAAMDLELAANRADLVYEKEYNLNTKPLEIDLLVIKKDKDVRTANEIGWIFRGYNILEYKSPDDSLDIDAFYKAGAYAGLYKAYGGVSDERKADDITVSLIRESRPDGLFEYFQRHNIRTTNPYRGIYYVLDAVLFPTQIIVSREMDRKSHTWLKALSGKMKKQDMKELLEKIEAIKLTFDRELADSVLEVSIRANRHVVDELRGDGSMCQALLEIMEPEINKIKEDAVAAAKEDEILCAVKSFRDLGASDIQIKDVLVKNHRLSFAEAEKYLRTYNH
ncbi:MAG: hypothetical protein HFH33_11905 [Eubacterium sp.]|jgi:hypothetical protein|nr:hypothetical protein [Eubacterium sp.]